MFSLNPNEDVVISVKHLSSDPNWFEVGSTLRSIPQNVLVLVTPNYQEIDEFINNLDEVQTMYSLSLEQGSAMKFVKDETLELGDNKKNMKKESKT